MKLEALLRQVNAVLSVLMLALFLLHGVGNAFQFLDVGMPPGRGLAHALLAVCVVHVLIGVWLTVFTLRAQRRAGVGYPRQNLRFWAVRASGLAIAAAIACHVLIFFRPASAPVRLAYFGPAQLAVSILLVVSIAVHVLASAHPLMLSLGVRGPRARAADLVLVLAVLLALMAVGFVVYFVRWSVV
jgi:hypothetical protein